MVGPRLEVVVFWSLEVALLIAAVVTALWVGPVFFLIAGSFALVRPYRRRSRVPWVAYASLVGAITGILLFAPLQCLDERPVDTCSSFVPIHYRVPFPNAPDWPAVVGMVGGALLFSLLAYGFVGVTRRADDD